MGPGLVFGLLHDFIEVKKQNLSRLPLGHLPASSFLEPILRCCGAVEQLYLYGLTGL